MKLTITSILPTVLQTILAVEQSLPQAGMGETKKQLVLNIITAAVQAGESIPNPLVALVSTFIDLTVQTLNAKGIFTKAPAKV